MVLELGSTSLAKLKLYTTVMLKIIIKLKDLYARLLFKY